MFSEFIHVPKCAAINRAGFPNSDYLELTGTHSLMVTHESKAAFHGRATLQHSAGNSAPLDRCHAAQRSTATASVLSTKTATGHRLHDFWVSMQNKNSGLSDQNWVRHSSEWQWSVNSDRTGLSRHTACRTAQIPDLQSWSCWPHVVNEHLRCHYCGWELRNNIFKLSFD